MYDITPVLIFTVPPFHIKKSFKSANKLHSLCVHKECHCTFLIKR